MPGLDNSEILSFLCKTSDHETDNRQVHISVGTQVAACNRHSTHSLTLCNAALRLQVVHYRLHHGRLDLPVFRKQAVLCKLHRAFCIYIGVASLDIDLHNWFDLDFLEPQWLIPLIMITTAIVLAYASEWASLCLFAANKLYDKIWQRIKNKRRRNRR